MATITTRSGKGSPLTHDEVDANFNNLNTDKLEASDLTQGTGISISGTTITNSAPDQTVSLTGSGIVSVSGTYPNFVASATALQAGDIGSSVQAYDANLTSFVSAFTLPITDGTSGQALATNASGTLSFIDVAGDPTLGTLTKSFASGETATITLSSTVSPTAVVAVTKEIGQTGVSSKGAWDVASDAANYELYNEAPATSLSLSSTSTDGTATLGTGSFSSSDVGKRIFVDDGGEAILTASDGSYSLVSAFGASSYTSGNWSLSGLDVDATNGITLSLATEDLWDVSTSTYSQSFSIASQETSPYDVFFKPDGTKMYVVGTSGDDVSEYSLSAAWDISTASYNGSFSVNTQDSGAVDVFFKPDGTRMYVVGLVGDAVYEYNLSTAWNVLTASYSQSFSVASQDAFPTGVFFKPDGTKMYVVGRTGDAVYEYSLSTAWDISTASYSQSFSVSAQEANSQGVFFKPDGTKMYVVGSTGDAVYEYDLSTAWDVSTASYVQNFSVASQDTSPNGVSFKPDGSKMYVIGGTGDAVYEYDLGTSFQPTAQYLPALTSSAGQIDSQYWTDINSMTADDADNDGEVYYAVSTDDRTTWSIAKASDGVRNIVRNNGGTWEYNSAVGPRDGWDLSEVSYLQNLDVSSQELYPSDVFFKPDGLKMYVSGTDGDDINEYDLSIAWDVTSASYSQSFSLASQETGLAGFYIKADGTKLYATGYIGDGVYEYSLSTAWDVSTASYTATFSVSSQEATPYGVSFKTDGLKMYIVGVTNDNIYEYNLSTAWDISSASYSQSFSLSSQDTAPSGIFFKPDGTELYVSGLTGDSVYQYDLSTAWDVSSLLFSQSFSVASQEASPQGLFLNADGNKLYVAGTSSAAVNQYDVGLEGFTTSETWNSATTNNEFAALAEALGATAANQMNKAQIDAVTDGSHFTLGDTLDLAIVPYLASAGTAPTSDGLSINYDAAALNKGAILGTDYDYDIPATDKVRITSLSAQNLKVRIV